jgi:MerR family Zn(II)-responsive transcriptional regulator of zntA
MRIGELAVKTGCTRDTIRFYERTGLFQGIPIVRSDNNYKHYDNALVDRVLLIKCAKTLGFTLTEFEKLVHAWENDQLSRAEKTQLFNDKIGLLEHKISEMLQTKKYLQTKLETL